MAKRIRDIDNAFQKLMALMKVLREECPWDREQTIASLRRYTLEETHEVLEAIDGAAEHGEWEKLKEELGDLLLQIAFYARIAEEQGHFTFEDIVDHLVEKMIYRHPHVFAGAECKDLHGQWERLKDAKRPKESLMDGIPPMPALAHARKLQERAARVGFDWEQAIDVIEKMEEELEELAQEVRNNQTPAAIEEEFGDVLFSLVNLGRKLGCDAELSLMKSNRKFIRRFRKMENLARKRRLRLEALSSQELEDLYREAKD